MPQKEMIACEVMLRHETEKAYGVCIDPENDVGLIFLPKSVCEVEGTPRYGEFFTIDVPGWLARQKGLV